MHRPFPWWATVLGAWLVILAVVTTLVWLGAGDAVAFGIGFGCGWGAAVSVRR